MLKLNTRLVAILVTILVMAVAIFFLRGKQISKTEFVKDQPTSQTVSQNEPPKIVSTKPDPLENTVIPADQIIEITFNRPLENVGEFKLRIEPKTDIKLELSSDRKTAKIIPSKPFELGSTYTIFIGPDTKFNGVGGWGEEKILHFKTVTYRGI